LTRLLIIIGILPFLGGCATFHQVVYPKVTLAQVCSGWDIIRPSRKDAESTLRQVRDANKIRRKVCVD
jgi:hypothetical protein